MMHYLTWPFRTCVVAISVLILLIGGTALSRANTGAPILLVVNDSSANKFGRYVGEILRAEGLNAFEVLQLSSLTATDLTNHDLTILAETTLNSSQATLFSNYVNSGGRLLALRPDGQIASLFGLGAGAGSLSNGYVKINTSAVINGEMPGQGLTSATLQIHGPADQYTTVGGSVTLAQLYSSASTATVYPAVVSNATGRAIAFTYDLAQNVVYTRQGNPANGDVDTDGDGMVRTIDLFQTSGGGAPWVDRDKIPVPQADEQQRLFARLVKQMVGEVRPLPQLWYFPNTAKTMLILTGDAHGQTVPQYQEEFDSLNAYGGKITIYLSIASDPPENQTGSNNDVTDWRGQGHTFGIHPYKYSPNPGYPPYDIQDLADGYDTYNTWFGLQYPNTPKSRTVRNHQVAWLGWTDAADIAASRGYVLDTNFYHWGAWLKKADNTWPHGYITGSGQPMKFIRADGQILNLYQQLTQLVDEQMVGGAAYEGLSGTQAAAVSQQLIDGSQAGDYAALMTQFHLDYYGGSGQTFAEGTLDYANSLGIPIWNADQWLNFTETRHDANYGNITWNSLTKTLTFDLSVAATSGVNLTTIVPLSYQGNLLESVKVDGSTTSVSTQTIKGVQVGFVTVLAGNHSFEVKYQDSLLPGLSVNDVSVAEGTGGVSTAVFTVSLSRVSSQTVTVNYTTANGTAVAPSDYLTSTGTLTFTPGITSQNITVTVQPDAINENDETFVVNLSNPVNATLADGQGVGTITNDDALPGLSVNDVNVAEGTGGVSTAVFTVSLSPQSGKTVSVSYITANGTAVAPSDYLTSTGTLTFTPGITSQNITVMVQADAIDENDETFGVNLSNPVNATLADGQGQGTILDDDALPGLSVNDVSVTEGTGGTSTAVFTVSLSAQSSKTISVTYATANGTAVAPSDYLTSTGTLTFTPGITSQNITVTVQPDAINENDETFVVNLSNPVNATLADGQGVGTITNDDALPGLSVNDVSVAEGTGGVSTAVFTVSLSPQSGKTVSVNYATANDNAVAPADYSFISGTLTFAPGAVTRSIMVTVQGDTLDENNETFLVNLSNPNGAILSRSQGQGTILDDDLPDPPLIHIFLPLVLKNE